MIHSRKQSQFAMFIIALFFTVFCYNSYAQETDTIAEQTTEKVAQVLDNAQSEKVENNEQPSSILPTISEKTIQLVSVAFFLVMLILVALFFRHIHAKNQYMGFQSIKYIGLVLMFPGICILALVGGDNLISDSTLAALLGTIAGYVLSREKDDDPGNNASSGLKKANEDLTKSVETLQAEIEALKKNPPS